MIELVEVLVAGGIGAVSVLVGFLLARSTRPSPPEPPKPICSCAHGYGIHGGDGGACGAQIKRESRWYVAAFDVVHADQWEYVPCPCVRYDGPEPLPRVWAA